MSDRKTVKGLPQRIRRAPRARAQPEGKQRRNRQPRVSVGLPMTQQSRIMPVAYGRVRQNPTQFTEGPIMHPELGRGQRFAGSQMLQSVVTTASDSQMWTGTAPAVSYSTNIILLNPDNLNGRLAVYAQTYSRYCFRKIELEYEPLVATSQAGGGVLSYSEDPQVNQDVAAWTYATAQEVNRSVTFPFRERAKLTAVYHGDTLWFTEYDATSKASIRSTCQGAIIGFPNVTSIGAVSMGTIRLNYVVDMFSPVNSLGIVACQPSEKKAVQDFLKEYRKKEEKTPLKSFNFPSTPSTGAGSTQDFVLVRR